MPNLNIRWTNVVLLSIYSVAFILVVYNISKGTIISTIRDDEFQMAEADSEHALDKNGVYDGEVDERMEHPKRLETSRENGRLQKRSQYICKPGKDSLCAPPFKAFLNKFRFSDQYHITACVIEKSMSTFLAAIMCYLYDTKAFLAANRTLATDIYENRFCKEKNEKATVGAVRSIDPDIQWSYLAVVREPVDRFLSGFVDKCIREQKRGSSKCYDCQGDLTCFMEKQYQRTIDFANGNQIGISYEDVHFFPQSWRCNFNALFSKYHIVQYAGTGKEFEEMTEQLSQVFTNSGVGKRETDWIRDQMLRDRTQHATVKSPERAKYEKQLRSDPYLIDLITRMYYYDYLLFGFPLPEVIR